MDPNAKKALGTLNLNKIWIPVIIGIGAVFYLIAQDDDFNWTSLRLTGEADGRCMLLVVLAVIVRDWFYIQRLRVLTHKDLSWLSSFYIIILWEFSSAVTPSVVGGGFVAIFLLLKEGISLGKSLAYVMVTTIFDSLFFILTASAGFGGAYESIFTHLSALDPNLGSSLKLVFWSSYTFVLLYTVTVASALFLFPTFFRWVLVKVTSISFLKRWRQAAQRHGEELILASQALQGESWSYWLGVGFATMATWSARYTVLNFIIAAYTPLSFVEHLVVFGKQIVMWTIMLISPTPGSSGTAEFFYKKLYGDLLGDYTLITDVLWRVFTYYIYLLLGAIYLPRWIKKKFATEQDTE
ncbi:MAG: lysylphosphatidylglycerol synthase transmembrane domain-containing protein [Roseivirga sp.]